MSKKNFILNDLSTTEQKKKRVEIGSNIDLKSITTAPSSPQKGDKYYNSSTKKIVVCTTSGTWGTSSTPIEGIIYLFGGRNYMWNSISLFEVGAGGGAGGSETDPIYTADKPYIALKDDARFDSTQQIDYWQEDTPTAAEGKYWFNGEILTTWNSSLNPIGVQMKTSTIYQFNGGTYSWTGEALVELSNQGYTKAEVDNLLSEISTTVQHDSTLTGDGKIGSLLGINEAGLNTLGKYFVSSEEKVIFKQKQLIITKTGLNGIVYPNILPATSFLRTIKGYSLSSNCSDFSVTISGIGYTKANITNIQIPANAEMIINDLTINAGYNIGNISLIIE